MREVEGEGEGRGEKGRGRGEEEGREGRGEEGWVFSPVAFLLSSVCREVFITVYYSLHTQVSSNHKNITYCSAQPLSSVTVKDIPKIQTGTAAHVDC